MHTSMHEWTLLNPCTKKSTRINTLFTWSLFKWLSCFLNVLLHVALGWSCCLWQNAKSTSQYEKGVLQFLTSWKRQVPVNRKFILRIFISKVEDLDSQADSTSYLDSCFFPARGHGFVSLEGKKNCPSEAWTCPLRVKWAINSVRSNKHSPWAGWLCKQGDTACNWITLYE